MPPQSPAPSTLLAFVREARARLRQRLGQREGEAVCRWWLADALALRHWPPIDDRPLPAPEREALERQLARLLAHEPLQYVLGHTEFHGLRIQCAPGVLIPRPETEELAAWVADDWRARPRPRVLDLGTGTGCLALAIGAALPAGAELHAWDISNQALELAARNARALGVQLQLEKRDMLLAKDLGKDPPWDIVVSNPPYVRESERQHMLPNVLDHEPALALFVPDDDPLRFYRALAQLLPGGLARDGAAYVELNENLSRETAELFAAQGFQTQPRRDLSGRWRMMKIGR